MREIEKQATVAWGSSKSAIAAWDFMRVVVPPMTTNTSDSPLAMNLDMDTTSSTTATQDAMPLHYANPVEGFLYPNKQNYDTNNKKRRR